MYIYKRGLKEGGGGDRNEETKSRSVERESRGGGGERFLKFLYNGAYNRSKSILFFSS